MILRTLAAAALLIGFSSVSADPPADIGRTEIAKWPGGRKACVCLTYDGGTINQFKVAVPLMDEAGLPATFFLVTGDIRGSKNRGRFVGRPVEEILHESASVPVDEANFFERSTALRFLPYEGARAAHVRAGDLYETGKPAEARREIEAAYARIRKGELKPLPGGDPFADPAIDASWDDLKKLAARGYEFATHTVTHPQPGILDDANLRYEFEKCREDILENLGPAHTFSCEWPHGSNNERVWRIASPLYPALRNRMPADWLEEISRWDSKDPTVSTKEYVQWQRGPKTKTSVETMKGWLDTCLTRDNVWLVLTFHGVDGIGYEPKTGAELREFFACIKRHGADVWPATFRDSVKYMRERMAAGVEGGAGEGVVRVTLRHTLDRDLYRFPLTLRTRIPDGWASVAVTQDGARSAAKVETDARGRWAVYDAIPNSGPVELRP